MVMNKNCINGHGPLRAWEGKYRCWTCGYESGLDANESKKSEHGYGSLWTFCFACEHLGLKQQSDCKLCGGKGRLYLKDGKMICPDIKHHSKENSELCEICHNEDIIGKCPNCSGEGIEVYYRTRYVGFDVNLARERRECNCCFHGAVPESHLPGGENYRVPVGDHVNQTGMNMLPSKLNWKDYIAMLGDVILSPGILCLAGIFIWLIWWYASGHKTIWK